MIQLSFPDTLAADLAQVDAIIAERLAPRAAVFQAAAHQVLAPGQRLRAVFALLCAQLGRYDSASVVHSAAAVELIHAASTVHDDLVDDAERRHGNASASKRWNGDVALMVGDYLFALAAAEMALAPDPRIIAYFSQGVMTICEGQLSPVVALAPREVALEQYLFSIGCKTASLFEAACKAGVVCGAGTQAQIDAMGRFGYNFGLAFQIVNDVLDYVGDESMLDKPLGSDLRAGMITLPLIYAASANTDPAFAAIIDLDQPNEERIHWAIDEVRRTGAATQALAEAQRYMQLGLAELGSFAPSPARQSLIAIAEQVVAYTAQ